VSVRASAAQQSGDLVEQERVAERPRRASFRVARLAGAEQQGLFVRAEQPVRARGEERRVGQHPVHQRAGGHLRPVAVDKGLDLLRAPQLGDGAVVRSGPGCLHPAPHRFGDEGGQARAGDVVRRLRAELAAEDLLQLVRGQPPPA
jgi:hypothetical protein